VALGGRAVGLHGVPPALLDECGELGEESGFEAWQVGHAACDDDARHADAADVDGEGEEGAVGEEM